jgi:hypothetical protein
VDRGSWGLEIMIMLMAWKLCWPRNVILVRGNHETDFCTRRYGFRSELIAKYDSTTGNVRQGARVAWRRDWRELGACGCCSLLAVSLAAACLRCSK